MSAGYSKRTLVQKLGIKPGARVWLVNPPEHYDRTLGPLPEGAVCIDDATDDLDFIHYFATRAEGLAADFPRLKNRLARDGMLWLSWPKGGSAMAADLNREDVRRIGLANGLVDVKVCAVDADWSGLKFVYRREDR